MTLNRFKKLIRRHARDEAGASLVEYTVVIVVFLLLFFAVLDFGRLGFNWVMTEKAMQRAARIATTRPPVCPGVPETQGRLGTTAAFGTLCRVGGVCAQPAAGAVQQCVLSQIPVPVADTFCDTLLPDLGSGASAAQIYTRNAAQTEQEIWCLLEPILPSNATPRSIRVSYTFTGDLGFVGGPYVPMVEVGVVTAATSSLANAQELRFEFITPLPALAGLTGGAVTAAGLGTDSDADSFADIPFPDLSVSLPGEDLNRGENG